MNPVLTQSYKNRFPFRLATTSFIYPASWVTNVRLLAPFLDEIELLVLESDRNSYPQAKEISALYRLGRQHRVSYNIHLPLDIYLGAAGASQRRHAVETIRRVMDITASLRPTTFTLHIVADFPLSDPEELKRWQERVFKTMARLMEPDTDGGRISVETLDYPLAWLDHVITEYGLSVCLDVGHLILNGFDYAKYFQRYRNCTDILHIMGVQNHKDHLGLDVFEADGFAPILRTLRRFHGTVSLEVFSFEALALSLEFLEWQWSVQ